MKLSDINDLGGGVSEGEEGGRGRSAFLALLFAVASCLAAVDLIGDLGEGASVSHWVVEAALFAISLVGLVVMLRALLRYSRRAERLEVETRSLGERLRAQAAESDALREELLGAAAEADRWRAEAKELLAGLSRAIDEQLERWALTEAEKEVALLLLKGLSHKEIATVRDTSDATARQQARAVYKKAGLTGRNDLSAFFLEDLLAPIGPRG